MAGYYDPNKDYSLAIKNSTDAEEIKQLQQERQNKIDDMYGGKDPYTTATTNKVTGQTTKPTNTSASYGSDWTPQNATVESNKAYNDRQNQVNSGSGSGAQQQAPAYTQNTTAPGYHVDLQKGEGYVTGGYTIGVNGTAILDANPYWKGTGANYGTKGPDLSRRPDLANKTAISNGYTIYYDDRGYIKRATKGVTDYLPRQDYYVQQGTYNGGNLWTDEEMLSAADLKAIADIRAGIASGKYTGDQANQMANAIRAGYGYTIDKNGYVTDSGVVRQVNDRRAQSGLTVAPETNEQGYFRYLWNTDTSPAAQAAGQVKSYQEYLAGLPSTPQVAPTLPTIQQPVVGNNFELDLPTIGGGGSLGPNGAGSVNVPSSGGSMGNYLDQWFQTAQQQQTQTIDYATQQAINELLRTKSDANAVFQEQRDQIAIDEAKAKDNQALYAERRGDKGGIGAAQYDAIMATAAQNRLAVNQAQTKLATDVSRQIADLRAQGEFEKADALLSLSQQYLSQLMSLEQWAAEYNLSVAQFNASLQQWQAEFDMAVADITGYYNGQPTFKTQQWQTELQLNEQANLADQGWMFLKAGIPPTESQLAAMGMTASQAQKYLTEAKIRGAGNNPTPVAMDIEGLFTEALDKGGYSWLKQESNYERFGLDSAPSESDYKAWVENNTYTEDEVSDIARGLYTDLFKYYSSQEDRLNAIYKEYNNGTGWMTQADLLWLLDKFNLR